MSERHARAALSRLAEPGDPRLLRLVHELGPERVYAELLRHDVGLGLRAELGQRLRGIDPARELHDADERGIRFVIPTDPEWPSGVDGLTLAGEVQGRGGPPLGLWLRGSRRLDELGSTVAIVGSRSATTYGTSVAADLAAGLGEQGVCVVSGAAFGIDQAAHRAALAGQGTTVAVLAGGPDRAYPAAHAQLLDYIADQGVVVSEVPPGGSPTRVRFLSRNRLIAALSGGTVVVEAAQRSGALNTANWTSRLLRPLMAVPGPITSAASQGVHELIRQRDAVLVTRAEHVHDLICEELVPDSPPELTASSFDRLSPEQKRVHDALPARVPAPLDSIARVAGLPPSLTRSALTTLISQGLAQHNTDGFWLRRPS